MQLNIDKKNTATEWRVYCICALILLVAALGSVDVAIAETSWPRFRHVVDTAKVLPQLPKTTLRLLVDEDFAPYSFKGSDGLQKGVSIDLARAACITLQVTCETIVKPFNQLLPALKNNEGDVIVTGLKPTPELLKSYDMTRAYFVSSARFVMRRVANFKDTETRTFAGKKLAYVKGTSHAGFLEKYYARSALIPVENMQELYATLSVGKADIAFGDTLQLGFWLNSKASNACCATIGKPFIDHQTFSKPLVFLLNKDRQALRASFDYALDRLEEDKTTGSIFDRYVPHQVW